MRGTKTMGGGWFRVHSIQFKLAVGYAVVIVAVLALLNTYPLIMTQNLVFQSKQASLQSQALVIANTLTVSDTLTAQGVEQSMALLDDLSVTRILVTNEAGLILFDTGEEPGTGRYALVGGIVSALQGNDVFYCGYRDGTFRSWAASPIMSRGNIIGSVCLYEADSEQGMLLQEIRKNLSIISLVVCIFVLLMSVFLSRVLTGRIGTLLGAMRVVREGEYNHRIKLSGRDELTKLGEEFNELTLRLQITEEARRRFVADASHELKTPLASIRLLTDSILQDETMDQETTREFVADIGEATDRLIRISEELLTLNRLDAGEKPQSEPVDMLSVVEINCRMLAPLAQAAQVEIVTELEKDCLVWANEGQMSQVVCNLMENAIKYNVPGGRVAVKLRCDRQVILTVEDTGVGIPAEDLPRIFDRFYRVDKARSRQAGGTGLGLSIVRDMVHIHGGQITVEPREEEGIRVTVTFPLWEGGA